jgi:ferredoxin-type protein NapH
MTTSRASFQIKSYLAPAVILLAFWALGLWAYLASGFLQPLLMFGYLGTALGLGLGLYAALPRRRKPAGRRLTLFLVGFFLVAYAIFLGQENIQVEGALFGLLTGVIQMAVSHYLIAKIFGPLLFGRLWCGWACWTVMVLDLLPFTRSSGRLPGRWGWLRFLHFGLSLAVVLVMVYIVGFRDGAAGPAALAWFIAGNLLYYAVGIALAYRMQDNRAFCKYVCPVSVPLKLGSRFSLLKVGSRAGVCDGCLACEKLCPMDIQISSYARAGRRVLSSECSLCQTCITVCPQDALGLTFGLDAGWDDRLRLRPPASSGPQM